jgi:hypothetical protein
MTEPHPLIPHQNFYLLLNFVLHQAGLLFVFLVYIYSMYCMHVVSVLRFKHQYSLFFQASALSLIFTIGEVRNLTATLGFEKKISGQFWLLLVC